MREVPADGRFLASVRVAASQRASEPSVGGILATNLWSTVMHVPRAPAPRRCCASYTATHRSSKEPTGRFAEPQPFLGVASLDCCLSTVAGPSLLVDRGKSAPRLCPGNRAISTACQGRPYARVHARAPCVHLSVCGQRTRSAKTPPCSPTHTPARRLGSGRVECQPGIT